MRPTGRPFNVRFPRVPSLAHFRERIAHAAGVARPLVLHNLERFAMYSDPMPETTQEAGDAPSPLPPQPPPKEMTMERYYERLKYLSTCAAVFAAPFAMSATLLLAVCGAFYSVSSEPMLADSPQARSAVAVCDALGDRVARQHCVWHLLVQAKARDAGVARLAALGARQRVATQ